MSILEKVNNMTKGQLIRLIHIAKNEFKLDDETYRELLLDITGKDSCAKMSIRALHKVYDAMKDKGFKRKFKKTNKTTVNVASHRDDIQKIRAIWITMFEQGFIKNGSDKALDCYVERMTKPINGIGIKCASWLDTYLASRVLESVKKWHLRMIIERCLKFDGFTAENNTLYFRNVKYIGYNEITNFYSEVLNAQKQRRERKK
jgi:phage gp16-like protein